MEELWLHYRWRSFDKLIFLQKKREVSWWTSTAPYCNWMPRTGLNSKSESWTTSCTAVSEITWSQRSERKKVELLKINKSTVPDHIPPKLIKLAGTAVIPALVALFRFSIERGLKFSSWKTARLAPIYKKDDETNIGNYRPVSLLSVPGTLARLWSQRLTHSRTTHLQE